MRRCFVTLLLLLVLSAVVLSGCGSSDFLEGGGAGAPTPPSKEEIVVWHTYSDEESRVFEKELIPRFEKEHPHIVVQSVRQPYSAELKSTIISRASSGKIPDIVRMDIVWVPDFSRLGLLYPVSDFADFPAIREKLGQSATWDTSRLGDRHYGLPLNMNTKIAIYNRSLLEKAGSSRPPESFSELAKLASVLGRPIGISGLHSWNFAPYFTVLGGIYLDPSNRQAEGYLNGSSSIKAVEELLRLFKAGVLNPNMLTGKGDLWNSVLTGETLAVDDGPWFYSILANSKEVKVDLLRTTVAAPFPGSKSSIMGGENLVILKSTKHLEACWTFLKWMTGREAQERMLLTGMLPTNKEVRIPDEIRSNPFIMASVEAMNRPFLRPPIAGWDRVDEVIRLQLEQIFAGSVSVQEGLDRAAAQADAILASMP